MKARFVFGLIAFVTLPHDTMGLGQEGSAGSWQPRLREAIGRATLANPGLAEMESRIEAARHRVGQAMAFPDPEIEVGIKDFPPSRPSLSRSDFTMQMVSARQKLPGAGKRPTQKRSAEAELASVTAMHAEHVVRTAAEVADAFFALAEFDSRIEILQNSRERLKRTAASATERYRVGKGAQADVLRANLETTNLDERVSTLRAERRREAARFNALQALPPTSLVASVELPEADPAVVSAEELLGEVEKSSPAITAAAAEVRKAEEQLELARLERRPDFTAMAYYARREKFEDLAGASVAFNLPFAQAGRLSEKQAEKEAELSGARAGLEAVKNDIRREVVEAYAELEKNSAQARLYRDAILPQAETNHRAAAEAYTVGQIDFLTFVRSALDLDAYGGELVMRRSGVWRSLAALQKASGLPLIAGTPAGGEGYVAK